MVEPNLSFRPESIQNSLYDASEGRIVASVTRIEQSGHLVTIFFLYLCKYKTNFSPYVKVVQEQPELLAQAIHDILNTINAEYFPERSKL